MPDTTHFQYCQKLVVLSQDLDKVLLARRKGEADYDGVFSFIGGKMEMTDESLLAGMKREVFVFLVFLACFLSIFSRNKRNASTFCTFTLISISILFTIYSLSLLY